MKNDKKQKNVNFPFFREFLEFFPHLNHEDGAKRRSRSEWEMEKGFENKMKWQLRQKTSDKENSAVKQLATAAVDTQKVKFLLGVALGEKSREENFKEKMIEEEKI